MRASSLLSVITLLGLMLGGCTSLPDRETVASTSNDWLTRSGEAISAQGQRLAGLFGRDDAEQAALARERREERQALFDQPYIDPLTRYLEKHGEDPRYAEVLTDISQERDRRCAAVADEYAERPISRETLARFRRGYLYSCPAEVNAFYARVRQQEARRAAAAPAPDAVETPAEPLAERDERVEEAVDRRQANDCYLLFTIRNLGKAREACRVPAEQDDPRAQRHMGSMAELAGEREEALRWYRRAVSNGDDQARERLEALTASPGDADAEGNR